MKSLAKMGLQVPDFVLCGANKLSQLLSNGYTINGVSIERRNADGTTTHGAVTTWGRVLWWHPTPASQPAPTPQAETQQASASSP